MKHRCCLVLLALVCGAGSGCGGSEGADFDGMAEKGAPALSARREVLSGGLGGDGASRPPVVVWWDMVPSEDAEVLSGFVGLTVENNTSFPVSVALGMRGTGLDQQHAYAPVGTYTLQGNETKSLQVRLDEFPLQSVGVPGQVDLVGTSTGPDWEDAQFASSSMYVQFAPDYRRAFASMRSTWAPIALSLVDGDAESPDYCELRDEPTRALKVRSGVVVTDEVDGDKAWEMYQRVVVPAMRPRGRYVDDDGRWVEVAGETVGGGVLVLERQQAELTEQLQAYADDEEEPGPSRVTGLYMLCAKWEATYIDAGYGEDHLNSRGLNYSLARHADATVRGSGGTTVWGPMPLDANGCTPTLALAVGTYTLDVKSSHLTPQGNTGLDVTNDQGNPFQWSFPFSAVANFAGVRWFQAADGRATRVNAVVSQLFVTPDPGLTPNKTRQIRVSNTDCNCGGACSYRSFECIGFDHPNMPGAVDNTQRKVVIAHEIGHGVETLAAVSVYFDYTHLAAEPLCRCDHIPNPAMRTHCLQSREFVGAAWAEGFAYFFAAKLFNSPADSDCYLGYSKDAYVKKFVYFPNTYIYLASPPPVKVSCRGPVRWRVEQCNDPYAAPSALTGTEVDWMTFLWNIHAPNEYGNKRTSMADYYHLKKQACVLAAFTHCVDTYPNLKIDFQKFRDAASAYYGSSSIKYRHIVEMGTSHGVRNGLY